MIFPLRDRWAHRVHLVHCRPWGITVGLRSVESESIVKCCKSQVEVLFRIFWLRRSLVGLGSLKVRSLGRGSFVLFLSCLISTTVPICCSLRAPSQEELLGVELWQPQKHIALGQVEGDQDAQGTE